MAKITATKNINLNYLFDGVKNLAEQRLRIVGHDIVNQYLSKEVRKSGYWVINKDIKRSQDSIAKWRTYIERPSGTNIRLVFRNDTVGKNGFKYTNSLLGTKTKEGNNYRAKEQGLTEDKHKELRDIIKDRVEREIKAVIASKDTSWIKGFNK